jgi:hypothetical protein
MCNSLYDLAVEIIISGMVKLLHGILSDPRFSV